MFNLSDVKDLLHEGEGQEVLSLYLLVDNAVRENQASNPAWRIWLKQHLRSVDDQLADEKHENWDSIRARAEEYFQHYAPSGKGVVAFFGSDWEQVYTLPVPVENQSAFGRPLVSPLLWALDEYELYLVVQVDQEEAHFYESYLGQTEFRDSIEIDLEAYDFGEKTGKMMASPGVSGFSREQFNNREAFEDNISEHRMRYYRDVADHTRQIVENEGIERIILGGSEESAHAVRKLLAPTIEKHVVDIVSIPRHYSPHEIFAHVQPLALEHERRQETELVDEVIDTARAGGKAVLGPEAAETALQRQQASHLIMVWPPDDPQMADDLAYQALRLNSEVITVHGEPADRLKQEAGGVAARLYYTM